MVKIRIPATSANIGPGFDSLGVALSMYNYIYMDPSDTLTIRSRDGTDIPLDAENLVYKTACRLYELCGRKPPGLTIEQYSNIPLVRGLGSSSACIVGGLLGANELMGSPLTLDELVDIAAVMEGHPDNSTPALMGGLVTAVLDNGRVHYVKQEVKPDLRFAAIVPDFEMHTGEARQLLPDTVSHEDARFNLSRAALMAVSLYSGKYENLRYAAQDRLHQPYRLEKIPGAGQVMQLCYLSGAYACYLSGAGPSLMSIFNDRVLDFEQKTRDGLDKLGLGSWELHILSIDNTGAIVVRD